MNNMFKPKFFTLLKRGFTKDQVVSDILSGVVVGIVALPLAIAFAVASGVSPEKGIITAVISGFIISLLGGSRVQIGGPTGAFIVIVYGIVETYGINGLIISTIFAGVILLFMGVFKLGDLIKYIPHPLVVGFTTAIAIIIFSTQIKDALGLNINSVPSDFLGKWVVYFNNIKSINIYSVTITILTIIITVCSSRYVKKIPGSFISIIFLTSVVSLFKIPVSTIETFFGSIPNNIEFIRPQFSWDMLHIYIKPAFTIAILGAIESLLSAVVADGMIGGNHRSNTELIAQGIANIVTPFFGGIPATGAIARTATNVKNGGRTPIAGIIHSITLLFIMVFLGKWAKLIPMATLAGVLIVVSYNMSEWRTFLSILKGSKFDSVILLTTFFLTLFFDLTVAIEVGVVLSAFIFLKRMTDSWNIELKDRDCDDIDTYKNLPSDVIVYEISGPLFFATIKEYIEVLKNSGINYSRIILRMRHVPFIDGTGLHNLKDIITRLEKDNKTIFICDVTESIKNSCENSIIKTENIFYRFDDLVKLL